MPTISGERLSPAEAWRLFFDFKDSLACVDIETDGTARPTRSRPWPSTTDARPCALCERPVIWNSFTTDILESKVLVTFNGRCFDAPVLTSHLGAVLPKAHIDVRNVLTGLGIKGGLKKCEARYGVSRGDLTGADGYFAVVLWREYQRRGDPAIMETLLAYNAARCAGPARTAGPRPINDLLPRNPVRRPLRPAHPPSGRQSPRAGTGRPAPPGLGLLAQIRRRGRGGLTPPAARRARPSWTSRLRGYASKRLPPARPVRLVRNATITPCAACDRKVHGLCDRMVTPVVTNPSPTSSGFHLEFFTFSLRSPPGITDGHPSRSRGEGFATEGHLPLPRLLAKEDRAARSETTWHNVSPRRKAFRRCAATAGTPRLRQSRRKPPRPRVPWSNTWRSQPMKSMEEVKSLLDGVHVVCPECGKSPAKCTCVNLNNGFAMKEMACCHGTGSVTVHLDTGYVVDTIYRERGQGRLGPTGLYSAGVRRRQAGKRRLDAHHGLAPGGSARRSGRPGAPPPRAGSGSKVKHCLSWFWN